MAEAGPFLEIINSVGLGLVGLGIVVLYRALASKSEIVSESVQDLRGLYESVISMMKARTEELDRRFDDEKRFRELYLAIVQDSEAHKAKIREWKEDELAVLQRRLADLGSRLQSLESDCELLRRKNAELMTALVELEAKCSRLERQNRDLILELGLKRGVLKAVE